ncbi:branched-chain amino acid ABC transporter permease [Streptomyces collinus]|uniref:branched-chain amino acid ABC transporter permease n=1 Tax=Streptomyces collinus TaxID=42684 RepID=UPI00379DBA1D
MDQTTALTLGVLSSAAVLALTAVGLSLSFGLMRIINLAHGEFLTIGAYGSVVSADHGLPWAVGLAAAAAVGLGVGALTELLLVRRLYGSPELSILATFGLSIVVRQLIQLGFGKDYRTVSNPLPGATKVLGVPFPAYQLLLTGLAVTVVVAVLAVLRFTSLGLRVRAVANEAALSETLGVRSTRVNLVVFAASAGLAATAGALVAPVTNVQPDMGLDYVFTAFLVVIVAGRRVAPVLIAALGLAAVQNLTTFWTDPLLARLAVLLLAFLAVQLRPSASFRVAS